MARVAQKVCAGHLTGTFEELHSAGCIQAGGDFKDLSEAKERLGNLFTLLMMETRQNPCNGCPKFNDREECKAFKQFNSLEILKRDESKAQHRAAITPVGTEKYPGMSLKQISVQLGVSKNEVQRRRDRGEL